MGTAVMATSQRPLCSLLLPKSGSLLAGRGSGVEGGAGGMGPAACLGSLRWGEAEDGQPVWRLLWLELPERAGLAASRLA